MSTRNRSLGPTTKTYLNGVVAPDRKRRRRGALSGREFTVPDVDSGYPAMSLVDHRGTVLEEFHRGAGSPDTRSFRLKLGLLVPATNCTMESELWDVIYGNRGELAGVGLHTSNIVTPAPRFGNAEELEVYKQLFHENVMATVDTALLAEPQYLLLGFSLEHFHATPEESAELPALLEEKTGLGVGTWAAAAQAALDAYEARRIALLCPFDPQGLDNAVRFFGGLGFEVVAAAGLGCASGVDVGHVPDDYKEEVIRERLLAGNEVDAVVVSGSNLSSLRIAERLEPEIGIPILGTNPVMLWYALRENGIEAPLAGGSRLSREF